MNKIQYNKYYDNVLYESYWRRLYDENKTDSITCLYSEIQIKLIELSKKFNLSVYYIECSPKTSYKVSFISTDYVDIKCEDVKTIKSLLSKDFYFLYSEQLFEMIIKVPILNKNNNYYYDLILVIDSNFDINKFYIYKFNIINIKNIIKIESKNISFDFVKNIISKRTLFNNWAPLFDNDRYKFDEMSDLYYIKHYCGGDESKYDITEKLNISSFFLYKTWNQNLYVKNLSKLLDMKVWSFDRIYIKEINSKGCCISYISKYDTTFSFITNFAELVGCITAQVKKNTNNDINIELKNNTCTYSCLIDNQDNHMIGYDSFDRKLVKTGFVDTEKLEIIHENEIFEGLLKKDIDYFK